MFDLSSGRVEKRRWWLVTLTAKTEVAPIVPLLMIVDCDHNNHRVLIM